MAKRKRSHRRTISIPPELWDSLEQLAQRETERTERRVTVSELLRKGARHVLFVARQTQP